MRDPEQVAAEFVADGQPYAVFIDNNLGSNRAYLNKLCQALRPLNKIWSAAVSIDVTDDPALIRIMALAGCTGVFVGFESLSPVNIADSRKKSPSPADYARRVAILHDWISAYNRLEPRTLGSPMREHRVARDVTCARLWFRQAARASPHRPSCA